MISAPVVCTQFVKKRHVGIRVVARCVLQFPEKTDHRQFSLEQSFVCHGRAPTAERRSVFRRPHSDCRQLGLVLLHDQGHLGQLQGQGLIQDSDGGKYSVS